MFLGGLLIGFIIGITVIAVIACVMAAGDSEKIDKKNNRRKIKWIEWQTKSYF